MKKHIIFITLLLLILPVLTACNKNSTSDNISVYTRDTTSGTREAFFSAIDFKEAINDDSKLVKNSLTVDGNGDMITKIKNDKNSIGYISLSSLNNSGVKGLSFNNVIATEENVLNNTYDLKRVFNYIITTNNETAADKLAAAFNLYLKTIDAMLIIKAMGGIVDLTKEYPKWDEIKTVHPITLENNKKVVVRFGGSTSVDRITKVLANYFSIKSGNPQIEHNYTGSGAAYKSTQGSDKDGNNALHVAFTSREFKESEQGLPNTFGLMTYDAIVVIVHNSNELININKEVLKDIYKGTYTKWEQVYEL